MVRYLSEKEAIGATAEATFFHSFGPFKTVYMIAFYLVIKLGFLDNFFSSSLIMHLANLESVVLLQYHL